MGDGTSSAAGGSSAEAEALRALEARLERAAAAAERLLSEAAGSAAGAVPPRGWQRADPGGDRADRGAPSALGGWLSGEDAELLASLLAGLRERLPVDLQQRLVAALHEVLAALRALIDWCLERAERRATTSAEVQDIPIL